MSFLAAPSMAWNSMRLPPQSRIAIATISLFCLGQGCAGISERPRARARNDFDISCQCDFFGERRVLPLRHCAIGQGDDDHDGEHEQTSGNAHVVPPFGRVGIVAQKTSVVPTYSCRIAWRGSSRVARRAGPTDAANATTLSRTTIAIRVKGSRALVCTRND